MVRFILFGQGNFNTPESFSERLFEDNFPFDWKTFFKIEFLFEILEALLSFLKEVKESLTPPLFIIDIFEMKLQSLFSSFMLSLCDLFTLYDLGRTLFII